MDFVETARIALSHSLDLCRDIFPMGKVRNNEYVVGDIYGNSGDSFSINLQTGISKDFASPEKGHGDLISLLAAAKQLSQYDAALYIQEKYGTAPTPKAIEKAEFVPIWPVVGEPNFTHHKLGEPSKIHTYKNHEGLVINYICRFELAEGKEFHPLSYGAYKGRTGWHWRQLPDQRPLYGLDKLPASGSITIVEGEKTAEALKKALPNRIVLTWPGGGNAIAKTDWSPLMSKNYDVLLWPDADPAGIKAMQTIALILKDKVASIGIVDVSSLPEKADAADFQGSSIEFEDFLRENRRAVDFSIKKDKTPLNLNLDFDPLDIPGLIGDTVRAIVKYALQPQPELALFNALAFAGAVFGRRYASPMNTRTNLYVIGIARTAGGKDFSRQYISTIADRAKLMNFMGAHYIRSDVGMLCDVMEKPTQLIMVDEIGMYLEAISNPRAPTHIRNVSAVLTKLYTSSGTFYDHGQTADRKLKPLVIQKPNLCIYGTTTEKNYTKALRSEAIESGELNRFLVYKSDRVFTGDEVEPPAMDIEQSLIDSWSFYSEGLNGMIALADLPPEPVIVKWDDECKTLQRHYYKRQMEIINKGEKSALLWGRYMENIIKIAMIFAIARDKKSPEFTPKDFTIAAQIVDSCLDYMANMATEHVADSDYQSLHHEVLRFFKQRPLGVTRTELSRHFQKLKARDLSEIITALKDQEMIEQVQIPTEGGRPKTVYRLLKA